MKPELTQAELSNFVTKGNEWLWQYKTLYRICYSPNLGRGEYYLKKIHQLPKTASGISLKGRFHAMTAQRAHEFLNLDKKS